MFWIRIIKRLPFQIHVQIMRHLDWKKIIYFILFFMKIPVFKFKNSIKDLFEIFNLISLIFKNYKKDE